MFPLKIPVTHMLPDEDHAARSAAEACVITGGVPSHRPPARAKAIEPMTPLRFGTAERGLLGMLHQPERARASATGVLDLEGWQTDSASAHENLIACSGCASQDAIYASPLVPPDALRMLPDPVGALA
jgi:hypothetical protein